MVQIVLILPLISRFLGTILRSLTLMGILCFITFIFLNLSGKVQIFAYLFAFFYFSLYDLLQQQNPLSDKLFSIELKLSLIFRPKLGDPFVS